MSALLEDKHISKMAASVVGGNNYVLREWEPMEASKRYSDKIALIGGYDPYSLQKNDLSDDFAPHGIVLVLLVCM